YVDPRERQPEALAKARVQSALDYLTTHGIPPDRISTTVTPKPRCVDRTPGCGERNRQVMMAFEL
ncbi:MAG TPA: hypothetical protein VGP07_15840, partial [Polyangia bacterium]